MALKRIEEYNKQEEKAVSKYISYCFIIFVLQVVMLWYSLYGLEPEESKKSSVGEEFQQLILQFACIVVLHFQLEGEVQQALYFINYVLYAKDIKRKYINIVFMVAMMQMVAALLTELLNLYNIFKQNNDGAII